jgi:transposase-like protein
MSVDKSQVREDYLRGFSVRMLAAKYGVPKSTVNDWIKKYGWVQEAKPRTIKEMLESGQEEPDKEPDSRTVSEPLPVSEDYAMLRVYTVKLLKKADDLLDLDDALAPRDLKSLSSMLLDVRTLLNVLSPREAAEQEMRLAALRKQAEKDEEKEESQGVTVRFETEGAEE